MKLIKVGPVWGRRWEERCEERDVRRYKALREDVRVVKVACSRGHRGVSIRIGRWMWERRG